MNDFADLLATKLCHDLSGAIGAVYNGIEFLDEVDTPEMRQKALELISGNGKEAMSRLQFFRVMYGVASDSEADLGKVRENALNYFQESKVKLEWSQVPGAVLNDTKCKLIYNLLYLAASMLLVGGDLKVEYSDAQIIVLAKGARIKNSAQEEAIIKNQSQEGVKVSNVQVHLIKKLTDGLQGVIEVEADDEKFMLQVSF